MHDNTPSTVCLMLKCIHFWDYVCMSCHLMKIHDHIYSIKALSHIHHTVKGSELMTAPMTMHALDWRGNRLK